MDKEKVSLFVDSMKKMAEDLGLQCVIAVVGDNDVETPSEPMITFDTLYKSLTSNIGGVGLNRFNWKLVDISTPNSLPYVVEITLRDQPDEILMRADVKWILRFGIKSKDLDQIETCIATIIITSDRMRVIKEVRLLMIDEDTDETENITVNGKTNIEPDTPIDHPDIIRTSSQHFRNIISCIREIELERIKRANLWRY